MRPTLASPADVTLYKLITMSPSPDFYALLAELFHQTAQAPDTPPAIPVDQWPLGSPERQLLEDFQQTLFTLQAWGRALREKEHSYHLLRAQADMRTREQVTLLEISQTLASALELQPGLILDQLRMIVEYTHATLFALENSTLSTLAVRGPHPLEQDMTFHVPLNGPHTLATLFNQHRPLRIANVWQEGPDAQFLRQLFNEKAALLLVGVQAWMWVPLAIKGRVIGGIGIGHTEPDFFTPHHANLALTVANQAAITMVNAELYERAQTLAILQERQHLAQNLHDAINQSLFSAALIAEVLPRLWERDPQEARQSLEDLRRLTRGAMAEMRAMLLELRLTALTDAELSDLLRLLSNALTGRTNISVNLIMTGEGVLQEPGRLPAEVQVALYRICQEGLSNVAKHAKASEVTLELHYEGETVALHLTDNGRGFDLAQVPSGHFGLVMMRERAEAVGADLAIRSQLGHGTEIMLHWSMLKEAADG